ncbi:glycosyltransferase [Ferruginibacter albus]|uniref:glycosyltransferase n=1 Tax=Ferruginibacter albus TaxID=2875540 RepID=UPI001CC4225A|nr:glycosyltransferase [Ferruginibacter albus]UAY50689.1 glycosyltransferase family protein [Ferruginibacter albus]
MISIVVCSVNAVFLRQLEGNINNTIGCAFEIIAINNNNSRAICEVYNEGVQKAKFDIICFCHEDISFETGEWGKQVLNVLKNKEIGLAGIAGSIFKSQYPSPWISIPSGYYRTNLIQVKKDGTSYYTPILDDGEYSKVCVIDGCFIAGRKEIFIETQWNETLLKGFHLYDMDISLRVGLKYSIVVLNKVKIKHFSEGVLDEVWLKESEKFHTFFKSYLPIKTLVAPSEVKRLDYFALRSYIYRLSSFKQPFIKRSLWVTKALLKYPFRKDNLSFLKQLFFPN